MRRVLQQHPDVVVTIKLVIPEREDAIEVITTSYGVPSDEAIPDAADRCAKQALAAALASRA